MVDGAFVLVDANGARVQIPVGGLACLMLQPGTRITHAAVALAARVGCLLVWVGEAGVRLYAAGQPGGARADRLLWQAAAALDERPRLRVVRAMYTLRFGEEPPARRSVDQLRGIEGVRVRTMYKQLARLHGVTWDARRYDPERVGRGGRSEPVPVGGHGVPVRTLRRRRFSRRGTRRRLDSYTGVSRRASSMTLRTSSSLRRWCRRHSWWRQGLSGDRPDARQAERLVRIACRDAFRRTNLLERLIPTIGELMAASGLTPPPEAPEGQAPALPEPLSGDAGHRG